MCTLPAGESEHETAALSRQESLDDDMWRHHHQHQDQYRAGGDDESAALPASFLHLASDRTYVTGARPNPIPLMPRGMPSHPTSLGDTWHVLSPYFS